VLSNFEKKTDQKFDPTVSMKMVLGVEFHPIPFLNNFCLEAPACSHRLFSFVSSIVVRFYKLKQQAHSPI
jgi:hypothetical protein